MLHRRPDLKMIGLRGNLGTRLGILEKGIAPGGTSPLHGMVLAEAGLARLGLQSHVKETLDPEWMLPAVGQGALGLECRVEDHETQGILRPLDDEQTSQETRAERAMLAALGGGCLIPIGCLAQSRNGRLFLAAAVLDPNGVQRIAAKIECPAENPEQAGEQLANALLQQGAGELLARILPDAPFRAESP